MDLTTYAPHALLALVIGYALGSIPFGLILTRLAGLGDIRNIGSGNIGATNVLRTGNKVLAATTLILDALKATAAVLIATHLGAQWGIAILAGLLAGLGAFLGHLYPVWLRFKGGKGVATYIGALLGWSWPAALVFMGVWLAVAVIMRYSSLAALVACVATPIYLLVAYPGTGLAAITAIMSVLLIVKHRPNIARLVDGTEPRIGKSSNTAA